MNALRDISSMYASAFSLVLFLVIFEPRHSWKRTLLLTAALMLPLLAGNFVLLLLLGAKTMGLLLLFTCTLPSLIFFWTQAKYRGGRLLFSFCLSDTLILAILHLTAILDPWLGDRGIFLVLGRLLLCPLTVLVIYRWFRKPYLEVQRTVPKGWLAFSGIALLFYIILSVFGSAPDYVNYQNEHLFVYLLLLLLMPLLYLQIIRAILLQNKAHELQEQEKITQLHIGNMRTRLEEFEVAQQQLRIERHDYRHKLQALATLLSSGQTEKARQLLQEYSQSIPESENRFYCSHPVLNAVFSANMERAESKQIRVTYSLHFPETLQVSETDLAMVFSNALENAINACEKLDPERRSIEIIVRADPCFMFQIRNSFDGVVTFDQDDIPISPEHGHGLGTRSIVAFCQQNRALYEFKVEEDTFALRLSFH